MTSAPPFAAVLVAGGRSTRMGRDKGSLEWRGRTFLELQLETLRALAPARLYLSVRTAIPIPYADVELVPDLPAFVDRGPLGALLAALERAEAAGLPRLLALAVDMPKMTAAWLRSLVASPEPRGVIPELSGGRLEPLAALWPVALLPEVRAALEGSDASLHRLARVGIEAGKLAALAVPPGDEGLFLNVNRKSDWESLAAQGK